MHFILKGVNSEVKLNSNISWNLHLPVTLLILKVSLYRNYKYTRTARPEPEPEASAVGLQRALSSVSMLLTVALNVPSATSLATRCMGATLAPSRETSSSETQDVRIRTSVGFTASSARLRQVVIYCDADIFPGRGETLRRGAQRGAGR